ncbi:MAG: 2-phospho-L-lactate transferase [Candidatus Heimdallarchaeota archaeon]|nr:2-phospho-L-lactate transferase [Candidatus Heimdallarchaeota archaeon]
MTPNKKLTFLSGGTGTPKLLLGFKMILPEKEITIIGNTGDDEEFYGILVSPDIDTLLYLFSDQLDLKKFWGVTNDTFAALQQLTKLGEETWFHLGDKDLALHLARNRLRLSGLTPTEITKLLCVKLNIKKAEILPMTNDSIRTSMITLNNEQLSFQEFTVKSREIVSVKEVIYYGSDTAQPSDEILKAIKNSSAIIIGPSNPITSIGPMLAMKQFKEALKKTEAKIIAVSPLSNGKAFSGPAARLMKDLKIEPSSLGVAKLYEEFLDTMIICKSDTKLRSQIEKLGISVIETNISLNTDEERKALSKTILKTLEI